MNRLTLEDVYIGGHENFRNVVERLLRFDEVVYDARRLPSSPRYRSSNEFESHLASQITDLTPAGTGPAQV